MKTSEALTANKTVIDAVCALRRPGVLVTGDRFTLAVHDDRVRIRVIGPTHPVSTNMLDRQLDTDDPCLVFDALPFLVALIVAE